MATKFVPLTAGLIDGGEFLETIDAELMDLQKSLIGFRRQYQANADGAKASLTIKIELKVTDANNEAYAIRTQFATSAPKRPSSVSLAMEGATQAMGAALFVRDTGSDDDEPRQKLSPKLFDRHGNAIDNGKPLTG